MISRARGVVLAAILVLPAVPGAFSACGERVLLGNDPPPCEGKVCGDGCTLPPCDGGMCEPAGADAGGVCNAAGAAGECVPPAPGLCAPPNPCDGGKCSDPCMVCMPGEPCVAGQCDVTLTCVQGMAQCPPPGPCAGLACGAQCNACNPLMHIGGCPPPVFCDPMHRCVPGPPPVCPPMPSGGP
jgi:hypothetical protein